MSFLVQRFRDAPFPSTPTTPWGLLSGTINAVVTTITPLDDSYFPSISQFDVQIEDEIITVLDSTAGVWTVLRGQGGTTAATHTDGASIYHVLTASGMARNPRSLTTLGDFEYMGALGAPTRLGQPGNGQWAITFTAGIPSWSAVATPDLSAYALKTYADSGDAVVAALIPTNTNQLTNGAAFITASALSPYLTSVTAAATYQPIGSYITGPANPGTSIQFNNAGSFDGSVNLTWNPSSTTDVFTVAPTLDPQSASGFFVNGLRLNVTVAPSADSAKATQALYVSSSYASSFDVDTIRSGQFGFVLDGTGTVSLASGLSAVVTNNAATVTNIYALNSLAESYGGTVEKMYAGEWYTAVWGTVTDSAYVARLIMEAGSPGSVPHFYGLRALISNDGATVTNGYVYHADDMAGFATNGYYAWFDSRGVYRIREDNTFDAVGQAIPALYNPLFTKYVAGAADFERLVEYWTGNVATFGVEVGGTGTNRVLNLVGSLVKANGVTLATASNSLAFTNKTGNISLWTNDANYTTLAAVAGVGYLTSVTNISGNAGTATAFQTARNINGVSFNGTADITVTAAAGTLSGTILAATVVTSSLTVVGTIATGTWSATTIAANKGGTGLASFTIGDLLQASSSSALAALASVATGNVLISGGVGTVSAWGKVGLTTHVSGILPTANGGTGIAFFTAAGPTTARVYTFPDAAATVLTSNAAVTVAQGGTNATSASITAFNNITGYTAAGATGTTSTNLVFSISPAITTPTVDGSITFTTSSILKMQSGGSDVIINGSDSVRRASIGSTGLALVSAAAISWSSNASGPTDTNKDTFIQRGGAAATVQHGQDLNGAAVSQILQACNGITGTDKTGGNFTLRPGAGTGAGAVSSLIFQTPTAIATGTTAQTQATRVTITSASMALATALPLAFNSGTNQRAGNTTLVGGTVTVSNATVTANTCVILTRKTSGGTIGTSITYTLSAGASFTITSDNILDTSTFSYMLIEVP